MNEKIRDKIIEKIIFISLMYTLEFDMDEEFPINPLILSVIDKSAIGQYFQEDTGKKIPKYVAIEILNEYEDLVIFSLCRIENILKILNKKKEINDHRNILLKKVIDYIIIDMYLNVNEQRLLKAITERFKKIENNLVILLEYFSIKDFHKKLWIYKFLELKIWIDSLLDKNVIKILNEMDNIEEVKEITTKQDYSPTMTFKTFMRETSFHMYKVYFKLFWKPKSVFRKFFFRIVEDIMFPVLKIPHLPSPNIFNVYKEDLEIVKLGEIVKF